MPMKKSSALVLLALTMLGPRAATSQVLLRWGQPEGDTTEAPAALRVRAFLWADVAADSGGTAFQLEIDSAIRASQLDPRVDLAGPAQRRGGAYGNDAAFDGDATTTWRDDGYACATVLGGCDDIYAGPGTSEIDLGGRFLLERIVLLSGLDDPGRTVRDFRIHLSDEPPPPLWCCPPFRPVYAEIRDNREQVREVPIRSGQQTRFLQVAVGQTEYGWEIHDVQVYGRGFVEQARYISNIVTFERPMAWGELRWTGRKGERARVSIQTRTGTDPDPQRHWRFTGLGDQREEVTRDQYRQLAVGERAGTTYDQENWSFWSAPYDFADSSGTQMVSPGPRAYFQFGVDFAPEEGDGGELRVLELRASPPAASQLVGEVWPVESPAGAWQVYTYFVYSSIDDDDDTGFDRLEIRSPSYLGSVRDVRVGDEAVAWHVVEADSHRFVVAFPPLHTQDSGALVEVDFDAQVLRYGARFDGRVWDSAQVLATPQAVDPGDATGRFEGNRVSVATPVRGERLLRLAVSPPVLTPNGDGVNDAATLAYEVFEITGPATVAVEVWDLSGRLVRRLHDGHDGVGRYERSWDGRDGAGRPVPPGVYLARVALATDRGSDVSTAVLHLAR